MYKSTCRSLKKSPGPWANAGAGAANSASITPTGPTCRLVMREQAPIGVTPALAFFSERLFSENGQTPHETPLVRAEIGAGMERAPVVPQQQVVRTPDMLVDELRLLLMLEQQVEKLLALGV